MKLDHTLDQVKAELISREPIFHRPELGTTRADFDRMMAPEFHEVGASGRRYSRDFVLDLLEQRHSRPQEDVLEASDFECLWLGGESYLITYDLLQDDVRRTRRSTIWRKYEGDWLIVFHQGTLVQDDQKNN
jgi:hypothetical protein